ncbi:hypothetical protein HDU93_001739 [Gonapodya sp. JEL0774]|nr:hypothetical protein HDU93_001739 [Gonapodya sp. JEL0774]
MSSVQEIQLIEAVEAGNRLRVCELLAQGENANARKRVSLTRRLTTRETKTDTVDCESVLALAIIYGHLEIVEALLAMGADQNASIDWKIADHSPPGHFTPDNWNAVRWHWTYTFPNPLCLAVGRGGTKKYCRGSTFPVPDSSDGVILVNKNGGHIHLDNPTQLQDFTVSLALRSSLSIVEKLLQHGAVVTDSVLVAARQQPSKEILRALERHQTDQRNGSARSLPPSSTATTAGAPPVLSSRPFPDNLTSLIRFQTREIQNPSNSSQEAVTAVPAVTPGSSIDTLASLVATQARRIEDLTTRNEELSIRAAVSESKVSELDRRIADLTRDNASLTTANKDLHSTMATKDAQITSLERDNAVLHARLANVTNPISPVVPAAPISPVTVNRVMYTVADFDARDGGELQVRVGDEVYVKLSFSDGWASGINTATGASGAFPFACVSVTPLLARIQPHHTSQFAMRNESQFLMQFNSGNPFRPVGQPSSRYTDDINTVNRSPPPSLMRSPGALDSRMSPYGGSLVVDATATIVGGHGDNESGTDTGLLRERGRE